MRFCFSAAFSPAADLQAIAKAGDESGWDTMTIPDHLINPVETRSTYPYTADGGRRWEMGTEWPDPWITIAHLAGMTERLRFLTTVYILPARTPVHVAKQVGTAAVLSGDRVGLGIGMGWMEEEFDAMGVPFAKRGKRADEMLEVLRKLWTGEVVEHHGEHFDVPPLELLPAPAAPIGIHVGGTSEAALRRAARNDGWVSDLHTIEELAAIRQQIERYREEYDRTARAVLRLRVGQRRVGPRRLPAGARGRRHPLRHDALVLLRRPRRRHGRQGRRRASLRRGHHRQVVTVARR